MLRKLVVLFIVSLLLAYPLGAEQQPKAPGRMSDAELKTFIHDLLHDLPRWQSRLDDYRRDLHSEYPEDAGAEQALSHADDLFAHVIGLVNALAEHETILDAVRLLAELDSLDSNIDLVSVDITVCPGEEGTIASYTLANDSLGWRRTALDIIKEIHAYSEKFYAHVLSTASLADATLERFPDWKVAPTGGKEKQGMFAYDGSHWKTLRPSDRIFYTAGFTRGYLDGLVDGAITIVANTAAGQPQPSLTPEQKKEAVETAQQTQKVAGFYRSQSTTGQLEATVSTFYGDYRNMAVCWDDALRLSASSLAGNAPTEQELNAARKAGAKSGCK